MGKYMQRSVQQNVWASLLKRKRSSKWLTCSFCEFSNARTEIIKCIFLQEYFNLVSLISVVLETRLITNLGPSSQVNKLPVPVSEGRSLAPLHSPRVRWETPLYVFDTLCCCEFRGLWYSTTYMIKHIITCGWRWSPHCCSDTGVSLVAVVLT